METTASEPYTLTPHASVRVVPVAAVLGVALVAAAAAPGRGREHLVERVVLRVEEGAAPRLRRRGRRGPRRRLRDGRGRLRRRRPDLGRGVEVGVVGARVVRPTSRTSCRTSASATRTTASPSCIDYVVHDLGAADVHVDDFKSVVSVAVPAGTVERALETKLYAHAHVDHAHVEVIRVGEAYSLPAAVAAHVSLVSELVRFPRLRRSDLVAEAVDAAPNATGAWAKCGAKHGAYTNPYVLAERYGFEFPLTDAADGNSMAVAEFQGQYWDPKDLGAFSTACGLPSAISVSKTVGGNVPLLCEGLGQGCVESLLDIEYAGSIAGAIPLEVYYSGTYSLLAWANKLGDAKPAPLVNSVSYGNDEAQQTGSAYMESVNAAFMKVSDAGGHRVVRGRFDTNLPRAIVPGIRASRTLRETIARPKHEPKRGERDRARSL